MRKWTEAEVPDLTGKVVIITGANSGLGFNNALQFAKKGAYVVMACRNMQKAELASNKIKGKEPDAKLTVIRLDLGSFSSIESFVIEFQSRFDRLDILLNNAGILFTGHTKTENGIEGHVGINHYGHFALTARLFGLLKLTPGSRVVTVSSIGHHSAEMDWDNINFENRYIQSKAYGRSKLFNLLFTLELDRRLKAGNVKVLSLASHPGISSTSLVDKVFGILLYILWPIVLLLVAHSAYRGALPSLRAATDPEVTGGEYFGPRGYREYRGAPALSRINVKARDKDDARRLWELSESVTGVRFEI